LQLFLFVFDIGVLLCKYDLPATFLFILPTVITQIEVVLFALRIPSHPRRISSCAGMIYELRKIVGLGRIFTGHGFF